MGLLTTGRHSLRRLGLFVLSRLNPGDVHIKHHYTGQRMRLHSFRHKGYWFHGRHREQNSMTAFARFIGPGQCVMEAGGHIGYISMYFDHLVGPTGSVYVFEPGRNNLPYLRENTSNSPRVIVVDQALGSELGQLPMYVEDLTGQNNSLIPGFTGLEANQRNAIKAHVIEQMVEVNTIDAYAALHGLAPDFVKIDVEGFEYQVLSGATGTLKRHRPTLMVEVQSNREDIAAMLHSLGYRCYDDEGNEFVTLPAGTTNVFCLPQEREFPTF